MWDKPVSKRHQVRDTSLWGAVSYWYSSSTATLIRRQWNSSATRHPPVCCVTTAPAQPSWACDKQETPNWEEEKRITHWPDLRKGDLKKSSSIKRLSSSIGWIHSDDKGLITVRVKKQKQNNNSQTTSKVPRIPGVVGLTGKGRVSPVAGRTKQKHPEWNHESRIVSLQFCT